MPRRNTDEGMAAHGKPPGKILRPGNSDTCIGHHVGCRARQKTPAPGTAEIGTMIVTRDSQRRSQSPGATGQLTTGPSPTALLHGHQTMPRLDGPQQDKTLLLPLGQHVEHPMHPVIQINISRSRLMPRDKLARRRTGKCMTRRITGRGIRFALDDHSATGAPDQFTTHQGPCAHHW